MPSTRSQGEPLTPYDPELNRTLRRMNNQGLPVNPIGGNLDEAVEFQQPRVVGGENRGLAENQLGDAVRVHGPPGPRQHDNYRGNIDIADSDGPIVLPPLPPGHTFVVTSSLMQMLTTRGIFSRSPSRIHMLTWPS